MAKRYTYSITTEYTSGANRGYYNPTFRWDLVQQMLDFFSRYWDVQFVRVNSGAMLQVRQAATNGKGWMWQSGPVFKVHPLVNWGRSAGDCASCLLHEVFHYTGFSQHLPEREALMHSDGGICDNLIPRDYQYARGWQWKSALRPHTEPTALRDTFAKYATVASGDGDEWIRYFAMSDKFDSASIPKCYCKMSWTDYLFRVPR